MRVLILETINNLTPNFDQHATSAAIAEATGLNRVLVESHLGAMINRNWLTGQRSFRGWRVRLTLKTELFLANN